MTAIRASTSVEQRADSLRRLLRGRSELDLAQFRFIELEQLAMTDGRAWPRRRDLLWQIAEIYLGNRIEDADVLVRGPDCFLVMFAERTGARAEFAAQSLAEGASERLCGLTDGPSPELVAETFTVPASLAAKILREHGARPEVRAYASSASSHSLTDADWLFRPALGARGKA